MKLTIGELPNTLTEHDKAYIEHETYHTGSCNQFYNAEGLSFRREYKLGSKENIERLKREGKILLDSEEIVEHLSEGLGGNKILILSEDELCEVSTELFSFIPRGKLYETYKSELVVEPILVDGEFNFSAPLVADHLNTYLGITPEDQEVEHKDCYENQYLIVHPKTLTYAYYHTDEQLEHPFEAICTNEAVMCDSLDLALSLSFGFAITECSYGM